MAITSHGYEVRNRNYVHRTVMQEHLGRTLSRQEHVHHKNGNKLDNRLENLEVIPESDHHKLHNRKIDVGKLTKLLSEKTVSQIADETGWCAATIYGNIWRHKLHYKFSQIERENERKRTCLKCGSEFVVRDKVREHKFCSQECYQSHRWSR